MLSRISDESPALLIQGQGISVCVPAYTSDLTTSKRTLWLQCLCSGFDMLYFSFVRGTDWF